MKSIKKYDWLIIVFIHEIEFGITEAEKFRLEIEQFPPGSNKILMIRDFRSQQQSEGRLRVYFHMELFELAADENNRGRFVKIDPAEAGLNLSGKDNWKKAFAYFFNLYNKQASRRLLLTWSHGAGFGINKEDNTDLKNVYLKFLRRFKDNLPEPPGDVWQVRNTQTAPDTVPVWVTENNLVVTDVLESLPGVPAPGTFTAADKLNIITTAQSGAVCKNLEILWIWELAAVLESVLEGRQVDILLMMNCNMQLFDTGYMLRKAVKYLVAPETQMTWFGYAYDKLFYQLSAKPQTATKAVLRKIRKDYIRKYKDSPEASQFLHTTTVFINRLKYYDKLLKLFEKSLDSLMPLLNADHILQFKKMRYGGIHSVTELGYTNSYDLIDMGLWLTECCNNFTEAESLGGIVRQYGVLIKKIVYRKFIGNYFREHDKGDEPKYGLTGISLYFPEQAPFTTLDNKWGDCAYYSTDTLPSPFTSKTTWDDFVRLFFLELGSVNQHLAES